MAKISLNMLFKRQRRMRYLTIAALFVVCAAFGQMILFQGNKTTKAMGDTQDNPYVINASGFIWSDGTNSYYIKRSGTDASSGCSVRYVGANQNGAGASGLIVDTNNVGADGTGDDCHLTKTYGRTDGDYASVILNPDGNKITSRHVRIDGNIVVAMWGTANFASFTVAGGAVVTHAPLAYMVGSGANKNYESLSVATAQFDPNNADPHQDTVGYTPGYFMAVNGEQDFNVSTGAISASGSDKKVEIKADSIRVLDGNINVMGRGYPGANGNNHSSDWLDRYFTDYYTEYAGHVYSSTGTRVADAVPVGLPLNYGGYGGFRGQNIAGSGLNLGGGGSGFRNIGGRATYIDSSPANAEITADKSDSQWSFSGSSVSSTVTHGDINNPTSSTYLYGVGGGGSGRYSGSVDRGGSGGGTISFVATNSGKIELHATSVLSAAGQNGIDTSGNSSYGGGAGAGGTIMIQGTVNIVNDEDKTNISSSFYAGGSGTIFQWNNSTLKYEEVSSLALGAVIKVNGGNGEENGNGACTIGSNCGGGGAGGMVLLNGPVSRSCYITVFDGDSIPTTCENQAVVIDGAGYVNPTPFSNPSDDRFAVYADKYSVLQPDGITNDTKRHFDSLAIINNAVLTHYAVTTTEMKSNPWGLIGASSNKKVDLVVAGTILLQNGGVIDVNGKGYPGGITAPSDHNYPWVDDIEVRGYGFGGGYGGYKNSSDEHAGGNGGGYGGIGGKGDGDSSPQMFGPTYGDNFPTDFEFGSGGGFARIDDGEHKSHGGNGGGRIRIEAAKIDLQNGGIYADGDRTYCNSTSCGGGGAGGSIIITITADPNLNTAGGTYAVDGGNSRNHKGGEGSVKVIGVNLLSSTNMITARGGSGGDPGDEHGGGGGGGRILIKRPIQPPVAIRKTLESVYRANVGDNGDSDGDLHDGFNPYAVLMNDRIRVKLELSGLTPGLEVTIDDDLLSNGTVSCSGNVADISGNGGTVQNGAMEWVITPTLVTGQLGYECTIQ